MAYNQAPLKNIGDIRENIAKRKANKKLGIENQPSAFVEVVREKGFKESISNPRTTKKEIQQTRIDRLKARKDATSNEAKKARIQGKIDRTKTRQSSRAERITDKNIKRLQKTKQRQKIKNIRQANFKTLCTSR